MGEVQRLADAIQSARPDVRVLWFQDLTMRAIEERVQEEVGCGKHIVALCVIDDTTPLMLCARDPRVTVFRTSLYGLWQVSNEHVLPYVFEPMPPMPPAPRTDRPKVAFCGWYASHPTRSACIDALAADSTIQVFFQLQTQFWGGKPHDPEVVEAFCDNMRRAEFNMCTRGRGNFSMRLYQTLSAGRIPVMVDTDMPLPFRDAIDWRSMCVVSRSPQDLAGDIVAFWKSQDIEEVQHRCRRVYETFFDQESIASHLARQIA